MILDQADRQPELDERDRRLARFMANVSHDLKTPLNAVVGFSSLLLQSAQDADAEMARQLLLIDRNAQRLLQRLDAMVEFFRLRAGIISPESDWLRPRHAIKQSIEGFQEIARQQGVALRMDSRSAPVRVRMSLRLLSRILSELMANAFKFTSQGEVALGVNMQTGLPNQAVRLCFSVADTGSGLEPANLRRLSNSLVPGSLAEQVNRTSNFEGLGLGLALAREAADLLGGWIEVDSTFGQGSRFSLIVELAPQDVEEAEDRL